MKKFRINQINLIRQITDALQAQSDADAGKSEPITATPRQFNAIIKAADDLIAAFEREPVYATPNMGLPAWLNSDDTGLSSMAMAHALFQTHTEEPTAHPHDPSDFGRCHRFLDAVPRARLQLPKMAAVSPVWARLVADWDELTALYVAEESSELYARMQKLGC